MKATKSPLLIAIVGSIDETRNDMAPPLKNITSAKKAAETLGRQLANAGFHILVYSSDQQFLEGHIVRGFVQSKNAGQRSIHVRYPNSNESAANFPEQKTHSHLFRLFPDTNKNWESSFYKSLKDVSGLILIGGGRSTFITGQIGLAYDIPMAAFASFGGSAEKIWETLSTQNELVKEKEISFLALPWNADTAKETVELLLKQRQRLISKQQKPIKVKTDSVVALTLFLLSLFTLPIGLGLTSLDKFWFLVLVIFSPVLSGSSGSSIRLLQSNNQKNESIWKTSVLGAIAGGISSLLYVIAQMTTNPKIFQLSEKTKQLQDFPYNLLIFSVVIGFIAGFTSDRVYKKLEELDALKADTIIKGGSSKQENKSP